MRSGYLANVDDSPSGVSVFAPSPILTVTIEADAEGHSDVHLHAGGQGAWIANMLMVLEARTLLCSPVGGEIGLVLKAVLDAGGLDVRSVASSGSNGCLIEARKDGELECLAEMPATRLNRHESDDLCNQMLTCGLDTGVAVLTGPAGDPVVDPDVYRRVASDLTGMGVRVVADLTGEVLIAALEGGISVLKISDDEVGEADPVRAARKLREEVADLAVLTRGAAGALALGESEQSVRVPALETVNRRGTGDSMTAGIAAGLARGLTLEDALGLGAGAGAVNVTRHGLASGRKDTIEKLAEQITIGPVSKEELRDARTGHQ